MVVGIASSLHMECDQICFRNKRTECSEIAQEKCLEYCVFIFENLTLD
jgi:hypothetical protein